MSANESDRVLDVREIDGPPFDEIVGALEALGADEHLRLVVPFEPVPLYDVLEERGFTYEPAEIEPGLYHVLIENA